MLTNFVEIWRLVCNLTCQCSRRISLKSDFLCQGYGNVYRVTVFSWTQCPLCRIVLYFIVTFTNKKAQLSLTNPRDAKACQKLLQFDVLTTLSLTILVHLHSFSCCCVRNLRNPVKFTENSNLWSSKSSKVIDLGVNRKPMYDFLLVTYSNFGRISATVFEILTLKAGKSLNFHALPFFEAP